MKVFRAPVFLLLVLLLCAALPVCFNAKQITTPSNEQSFESILFIPPILSGFRDAPVTGYHCASEDSGELVVVKRPDNGGIKEIIPDKFRERYEKWKGELLAAEVGRQQWENYSNNKHFILTITIASQEGQGAGTGKYQWDETGELVGATITLGNKIEKGLPNPIYFPVMNSLSSEEPAYTINGNILAATKFAHEFGHVNQTARMKSDVFQLQNKLMPLYNEILLKNGYNTNDQRLIDLAKQMGGTPVEVWENREYWGEANAMLFLADRIDKESYHCLVYNKLRRNVELYAKSYAERFEQIAEAKNLEATCGK